VQRNTQRPAVTDYIRSSTTDQFKKLKKYILLSLAPIISIITFIYIIILLLYILLHIILKILLLLYIII